MPAPGQAWTLNLKVASCILHSVAISSGIFRSTYRWYISRFGWEDAWATFALITDIGCLVCSWMQQSSPAHLSKQVIILNFIATVTVTSVPWQARLSMIITLIQLTKPLARFRRTTHAVAVSFGLMWIAILGEKLYVCSANSCAMTHYVAISQLTTDTISDLLLVVLPVCSLRGTKISRGQRLMLVMSFAASICITAISIAHAISLFRPLTSGTALIVYAKAAIALIVCNLLVIVTFIYKFFFKTDMEHTTESQPVLFTTIIPGQQPLENFSHSTTIPMSTVDY